MKRIFIIIFCSLLLLSTQPAHAKIFRDIIVGGLTGGAGIAEGKSAPEVFDSTMSAISDSWAVGSSLFKIFRARMLKEGQGGSVRFFIERYKMEKIYDDLVDRLEGKERSALIADQKQWNKTGLAANAKALEKNGLDRTRAYEVAMTGRYNKLLDMWRDLGASGSSGEEGLNLNQSWNNSSSSNSLNFGTPQIGDQICGDVISQTSQDSHTVFVLYVKGESTAYYSADRSCSKPRDYVCAKLIESDETTPELKDLGIDSEEVYKIANCVRP